MSFRDRSNVIELSKRLRAGYKVLGKEHGILWSFPLVLSNSYVSIWRTKACIKHQEDAAFENLLSFILMKENGQKDNRPLQIICSSMLNSEQMISSVNWGCISHQSGWSEGRMQTSSLITHTDLCGVRYSTMFVPCCGWPYAQLRLLGTDYQTWQVTIPERHTLNSFLWSDIKAYSKAYAKSTVLFLT